MPLMSGPKPVFDYATARSSPHPSVKKQALGVVGAVSAAFVLLLGVAFLLVAFSLLLYAMGASPSAD
jgi:hypothetical protein